MTMEQVKLDLLTQEVEDYYKTSDIIKRLQSSQEEAKARIAEYFEAMGESLGKYPDHYDTGTGLRARFQLRFRESISVEEARVILDQPIFDKLLKVSEYRTFSVVMLKEKE